MNLLQYNVESIAVFYSYFFFFSLWYLIMIQVITIFRIFFYVNLNENTCFLINSHNHLQLNLFSIFFYTVFYHFTSHFYIFFSEYDRVCFFFYYECLSFVSFISLFILKWCFYFFTIRRNDRPSSSLAVF